MEDEALRQSNLRRSGVTVPGINRRAFLQFGLAVLGWLGRPWPTLAADGPAPIPSVEAVAAAFEATTAPAALRLLYGDAAFEPSAAVALTVPTRIDNGANVPVSVATDLPGVRAIAIVVDLNPRPLAALYELPAGTRPEIACRIKIAQSCKVLALVATTTGVFSAAANVTVTQGGCA